MTRSAHASTLPTGPLPTSMDYSELRAEGVALLERLTSAQWTDYNAHDPGITILEQLCYALTDLGYRLNHPMEDLLAGGKPDALPGPLVMLTGDPVTANDLRKLALSVEGVANAWVEPRPSALSFFHHPLKQELHFDPEAPDAAPVAIGAQYRLLVQPRADQNTHTLVPAVEAAVQARRLLGQRVEVALVGLQTIGLELEVEVGPVEEPAALAAALIDRLERHLAPPAVFESFAQARAGGRPMTELFEGPPLSPARGVLVTLPARRAVVYESDLVREVMDEPQVRGVRRVALADSPTAARVRWALPIRSGSVAVSPDLIPESGLEVSGVRGLAGLFFFRDGARIALDPQVVRAHLEKRREAREIASGDLSGLEPPAGRKRALSSYHSISRQFPAAYGLPPAGLSRSASPLRRAQALQLEAYLHLFDQLLANAFAQLGQLPALLSADEGGRRANFAQPVEGDLPRGAMPAVLQSEPEEYRVWLEQAVEPEQPLQQRKRLLAHLLGRYGEQLGYEARGGQSGSSQAATDERIVSQRQAFLARYPRLSAGRGSGVDVNQPEAPSAFAERLRLKLDLGEERGVLVVEHVLLSPIAADRAQRGTEQSPVPLLTHVARRDPWSAQLTVVIERLDESEVSHAEIDRRTAEVLVAEVPAHLTPRLLWYSQAEFSELQAAFTQFRRRLRDYRAASSASTLGLQHLALRDARDAVTDRLAAGDVPEPVLGWTLPLRDIPLTQALTVAHGGSARVRLDYSQPDVRYQLFVGDTAAGEVMEGVGGPLELQTPAVTQDVTFRIQATKAEPSRSVWLHRQVRVQEGVDPDVRGEFISMGTATPLPALSESGTEQARLAAFGETVAVRLTESQEGVAYVLVDAGDGSVVLSEPVVGTSGVIDIPFSAGASEDVDVRLRGTRELAAPGDSLGSALLQQVLPLRVRANPDVQAQLTEEIVAHGSSSAVRLSSSQPTASYQLFVRPARSADYHFGATLPPGAIAVNTGAEVIGLQRPPGRPFWEDLEGLVAHGSAAAGNGGTLDLPLLGITEDAVILIQATKRHQTALATLPQRLEPSAVPLIRALAVLVRPDPQVRLQLSLELSGDVTAGPWEVSNGQPGVFYEVRNGGSPIGNAVYFHRESDELSGRSKGVGELRVERDLALVRVGVLPTSSDPPPAPWLDATPQPVGVVLGVLARQALSGVTAPLAQSATVLAMPTLHIEPAPPSAGDSVALVVEASVVGEHYSVWQEGAQRVAATAGTGGDLALSLGAIGETTVLELRVERPGAGLPVVRRVRFSVAVS